MKKIFISSFIFIFLLACIEFGVRFYIKLENSRNTGINLKGKTYGIMRMDYQLGFTHIANTYNTTRSTNNMGFLNRNDVVLPEQRNIEDVVFIAYGGMAAVPKRARACEEILKNKLLTINTFIKAKDYLEKDFMPIGDMRASKEYRLEVAKNLLIKCFVEINTKKLTRVI